MSGARHVDGVRLPDDRPLTANELAWVEFIRMISCDTDPTPSLRAIQTLRSALAPVPIRT